MKLVAVFPIMPSAGKIIEAGEAFDSAAFDLPPKDVAELIELGAAVVAEEEKKKK